MNEFRKTGTGRQLWRFYRGINGRILLVCLIISGFIWLLRNLSKEFESHVPMQVELSTLPANCIWLRTQAHNLDVEIESFGFSLLGSGITRKENTIELDFASYTCRDGMVSLPTSRLRGQIARLLGREQAILSIYPDTLRFEFSEAITKEINVKVPFIAQLKEGSFLDKPPKAIPNKIKVTGPASILDTMTALTTETIKLSGSFKDTLSAKLTTHPLIEGLNRTVGVVYSTDEYSEKSFRVPIQLPQVNGFKGLRLFPDSVILTCLAGTKQLGTMTADSFRVEIAEDDLPRVGEAQKLNLSVTRFPIDVSEVQLRPGRIEYLILKTR